jgi:anti-sigma factor ChrR (cupin superfamily)
MQADGLGFVNGDRSLLACVHDIDNPWRTSPHEGVTRKLLERFGGEVALATSIVRYAPRSSFSAHRHDMGEEFLVLSGTFSDEHGDYGAGAYVRNPPGSRHRPFSKEGCTIFVKLRQMTAADSLRSVLLPREMAWEDASTRGCERAVLHARGRETVHMVRLEAGCTIPARRCEGGEEIFVVEGSLQVGAGPLKLDRWGWRRCAEGEHPALATETGALLWTKHGHLE